VQQPLRRAGVSGRAFSSSTVRGRRACRSSRGPPGDAGNNPCRRQGDRVVAPGSTGRRLLVEDDHGASGGKPISRRAIAWRAGAGGASSSDRRACPDERPGRESPLGEAHDDHETFGPGRRFAPGFAGGCGRRHAPGRRARVSSRATVSLEWTEGRCSPAPQPREVLTLRESGSVTFTLPAGVARDEAARERRRRRRPRPPASRAGSSHVRPPRLDPAGPWPSDPRLV